MQYKDSAKNFHSAGFNVTCISYLKTKYNLAEVNPEKAPSNKWIDLQIRRQAIEEIDDFLWDYATGLGCVIGHNNIVCIDIDGCNDILFIESIFKFIGFPENYVWGVKTPNGFHIYIQSSILDLPFELLENGILSLLPNSDNSNKLKRIEFRFAGHCVLPPSNINGKYRFLNTEEVPDTEPKYLSLFDIYKLMAFISGSFSPLKTTDFIGQFKIGDYHFGLGYSSTGFASFKYLKDGLVLYELKDWYQSIDLIKTKENQNQFYLDIETTGLIKNSIDYENYPRIIQISNISVDYERIPVIKEENFYVKDSNIHLSDEIKTLTGITNEVLQAGKKIDDILLWYNNIPRDCIIISHNAEFDLSILDAEFFRLKRRNPFRDRPIFCTMKSYAEKNNTKYPSLSELYELLFKEPVPYKLHNSMNDVKILRDCYKLMCLYGYRKKL